MFFYHASCFFTNITITGDFELAVSNQKYLLPNTLRWC